MLEATTYANGDIRLDQPLNLPAHMRVYVVVPKQSEQYSAIVPQEYHDGTLRIPFVRIVDDGLAKRMVKTVAPVAIQ